MARSPRARLVLNPTLQLAATGEASRRGAGRRRIELTDPTLLHYVLAALEGRPRPRLDARQHRRLRAAGVLVRPDEIPRDVHLDARLDAARRALGRGRIAPRDLAPPWRLARGCRLMRGAASPRGLTTRGDRGEAFVPATDVLWVPSPGNRIVVPYTLTPRLAALLRRHPRVADARCRGGAARRRCRAAAGREPRLAPAPEGLAERAARARLRRAARSVREPLPRGRTTVLASLHFGAAPR
jgi:hypothetical protein